MAMNDIAEERPDFFEGEYLGADDLQQLVVYMRDQSARHALGGHAWGIAAGLDLIEQPSPSGSGVDVYLLPGYAVDGFGRAVVVVNPLRLTVDRFTGLPSGPQPVWLYYQQGGAKGVRPGFEVCSASDAYARVAESYDLAVGDFELAKQQTGISVAGVAVPDAREALRVFDDNGPIACDASVPYQDLPLPAGDEKSRWLVPLGLVNWQAGVPGSFQKLAEDDQVRARRRRRYLGVVAESVLAADGLIRLRRRTTPYDAAQGTDQLCLADDLAAPAHDEDAHVCDGRAQFNELVWVEGRMRVTGDTRLLAARLEFRDASGTEYLVNKQPASAPLFFQRDDRGKNADLQLLVGKPQSGHNNFVIANAGDPTAGATACDPVQFNSPAPLVTVQDDGNVAIGPDAPDERLTVEGTTEAWIHVKATSGPNHLYAGASADGAILAATGNEDFRIRTGGADQGTGGDPKDPNARLTIDQKGRVGIGTISPDKNRLVTLERDGGCYLIARTVTTPHEAMLGADDNGAVVSANTPGDDLVLASNGNAEQVWVKADGKLGVGTPNPDRDVTVLGRSTNAYLNVRASDGREILMGADWTGTMVSAMTNDDLQLRAGGNQNCITIKASKNVGVGTDAPQERLDVRGNVKLGGFGELFAAGSPDNLRIVAGTVDGGGNWVGGGGFTPEYLGEGTYRIHISPPFSGVPVVIATSIASSDDDLCTTKNLGAATFEVHVYDTSLHKLEDNSFSFVAFGPR